MPNDKARIELDVVIPAANVHYRTSTALPEPLNAVHLELLLKEMLAATMHALREKGVLVEPAAAPRRAWYDRS